MQLKTIGVPVEAVSILDNSSFLSLFPRSLAIRAALVMLSHTEDNVIRSAIMPYNRRRFKVSPNVRQSSAVADIDLLDKLSARTGFNVPALVRAAVWLLSYQSQEDVLKWISAAKGEAE